MQAIKTNLTVQAVDKQHGFGVSSKYVAINSAQLIEQFSEAGFEVRTAQFAHVRNEDKRGFQKHIIRFRQPNVELPGVGGVVPEIVLRNSYDGTSSFELMLGLYRLVCSNGLLVGNTFESVRVRHVGNDAVRRAVEAATHVVGQAERAARMVREMQKYHLDHVAQLSLASRAAEFILPDTSLQTDLGQLLRVRRAADESNDLWTVFNRIQENAMQGGLRYTVANADGQIVNRSTRRIKSIDRNVHVNRALFDLVINTYGIAG